MYHFVCRRFSYPLFFHPYATLAILAASAPRDLVGVLKESAMVLENLLSDQHCYIYTYAGSVAFSSNTNQKTDKSYCNTLFRRNMRLVSSTSPVLHIEFEQ